MTYTFLQFLHSDLFPRILVGILFVDLLYVFGLSHFTALILGLTTAMTLAFAYFVFLL